MIFKEYIESVTTLNQVIENSGAQPADKVIEWAKEICDLFRYMYSFTPPYICRDMKTSNVILMPNQQLKVIEADIAEITDLTEGAYISGTKGYCAPEQCGGTGQLEYVLGGQDGIYRT